MISPVGHTLDSSVDPTSTASPRSASQSPHPSSNATLSLIGFAGYAASQWLILVAMARLGGSLMVGQYALALSIAGPIFMFTNMNLMSLLASENRTAFSYGTFHSMRVLGSAGALLISILGGFVLGYRGDDLGIIACVALYKLTESVAEIGLGLFVNRGRFDALARSMLMRGLATVLTVTLLAAVGIPLGIIVAVAAMVQLAMWYTSDLPLIRQTSGSALNVLARPEESSALLRIGLPLGLVALMISLQTSIPRIALEKLTDPSSLGIFAAVSYAGVGGRMVASAFGLSALPQYGNALFENDLLKFKRILWRMQRIALGLGLGGILASVVAGPQILTLFYGRSWAAHSGILVLTMVSSALWYSATFLQDALTSLRIVVPKTVILAISLGATALTAATLVPTHGIDGAALSVLVGGGVELMASASVVHWALKQRSTSA